jgi:hypothetical protein
LVGKAGLKAGLIGTAIMIALSLLNNFVILPNAAGGAITYVMCGVSLVFYAGIGVMAGLFHKAPRTAGKGAGAGAIAGLISGVISVVVGLVIMSIRMAGGGDIPGLTPEQMEQLSQLELNPALLMVPGAVCGSAMGAGAAAIGGALLSAIKPE